MPDKIKVGDVVHLNSGSPDLIVVGMGFGVLYLQWWDGVEWGETELPVQCVHKVLHRIN